MNLQVIKPSDGDTYLVENHDGELKLIIDSPKPIKNLILQFPETPYRAAKIRIHTNQDILNLMALGNFAEPLDSIKAGNVDLVFAPIEKEYLRTGTNESNPNIAPSAAPPIVQITEPKKRKIWRYLLPFFLGMLLMSAIIGGVEFFLTYKKLLY